MSDNEKELKDRKLFNEIADMYFQKDKHVVSSKARRFQLLSLVNLYVNHKNSKASNIILELGCGVGASSKYLIGLFDKYIGVDYSDEFINIANQVFANDNIVFYCSNIKHFKTDTTIDFVFGVGVLHHVTEIEEVLKNIRNIGDKNTLFGFVEPQSKNPFIQFLRKIRMKVDKSYSPDQAFFTKSYIVDLFEKNGFEIKEIRYQGYFTPPFAQVVLKPAFIFTPLVNLFIGIDRFIQKSLNNPLSWNIIWIASKK